MNLRTVDGALLPDILLIYIRCTVTVKYKNSTGYLLNPSQIDTEICFILLQILYLICPGDETITIWGFEGVQSKCK